MPVAAGTSLPRGIDPRVTELLLELRRYIAGVLPVVMVDGTLVRGVSLAASDSVAVEHGLQRAPLGWFLVRPRGAAPMVLESASQPNSGTRLSLTAEAAQSGTCEFDIWIF